MEQSLTTVITTAEEYASGRVEEEEDSESELEQSTVELDEEEEGPKTPLKITTLN